MRLSVKDSTVSSLRLNRETVRELAAGEMGAAGGNASLSCNCTGNYQTLSACVTQTRIALLCQPIITPIIYTQQGSCIC
jgi:hypothetical protein